MWMQENFRSELSKNLNMGVLILKQIYEEAERQVAPHMVRQVEGVQHLQAESAVWSGGCLCCRGSTWTPSMCTPSRTRVGDGAAIDSRLGRRPSGLMSIQ